MMDYRIDVIYVNFIALVNLSRGNFACLYFESQHPPSDCFSCHELCSIKRQTKRHGFHIDIVHTWSFHGQKIHNFLNGKSNQHREKT